MGNDRTFILTEGMIKVTITQFENAVELLKVLTHLSPANKVKVDATIDFFEEALKRLKQTT